MKKIEGQMGAPKKLLCLESLRGIAALSVVIYHFDIASHFNTRLTDNAWIMVDFFFVLSGFVIALNYRDKIGSFSDLLQFQKKRFYRLYPLHFVMLLVFLAIECAKLFAQIRFELIAHDPAFSHNDGVAFGAHVFLLQNWLLPQLTFNGPSWSISAEFFTYLIFAGAVLCLGGGKKQLLCFSVFFISLAFVVLYHRGFHTDNISGPARCIFGFFCGVIGCVIYQEYKSRLRFQTSFFPLMAMGLCLICIYNLHHLPHAFYLCLPLVFALSILVLVTTSERTWVNRLLSQHIFVYLGSISYGIYMIHKAIWWAMHQILRFVFHFPTEISSTGRTRAVIENPYLADGIMLIGISVILLLAHLSYVHLERRF